MIFNKETNKLLLLIIIICIIIFISLLYVYYCPKYTELFTNSEEILSKYKDSIINITNLIRNITNNKLNLNNIIVNNDLTVYNNTNLNKLNITNESYFKIINFGYITLNNREFSDDRIYDLFNIQIGSIDVNAHANMKQKINFKKAFINTPIIILSIQNIINLSENKNINLSKVLSSATTQFFEIDLGTYDNINYIITWIAIPKNP
jgi:hypothetical protein